MTQVTRGWWDAERILFTRVEDCPNNYTGPCALAHTCVAYERDADGVVRVRASIDNIPTTNKEPLQ